MVLYSGALSLQDFADFAAIWPLGMLASTSHLEPERVDMQGSYIG